MPDITIPDDAVEATAALIYETRTYRLWADAPDDIKASWRGDALEILAAAAPYIAAQALRDAADSIKNTVIPVGNLPRTHVAWMLNTRAAQIEETNDGR